MRDAQEKGREIGLQVLGSATNEREVETAFEKLVQKRAGALLVNADAFFTGKAWGDGLRITSLGSK